MEFLKLFTVYSTNHAIQLHDLYDMYSVYTESTNHIPMSDKQFKKVVDSVYKQYNNKASGMAVYEIDATAYHTYYYKYMKIQHLKKQLVNKQNNRDKILISDMILKINAQTLQGYRFMYIMKDMNYRNNYINDTLKRFNIICC